MLIDPTRVTLRPGSTSRFLNIDYDDQQIGHLTFDTDGSRIVQCWAIQCEDRPLVELIARCHRAFAGPQAGRQRPDL